jgi:hypothetical protein
VEKIITDKPVSGTTVQVLSSGLNSGLSWLMLNEINVLQFSDTAQFSSTLAPL